MVNKLNEEFNSKNGRKQPTHKEKDDILRSGRDLLLYEYLEEVAVRITSDNKCYLKFPNREEYEVIYEKSEIAGRGYAYGIPMTEEEYKGF